MAKSGMKNWILTGVLMLFAQPALALQHYLIIVSGIGGDEEYSRQFSDLTLRLYESAIRVGIAKQNIISLSAQPLSEVSQNHRISNKETFHRALAEISTRARVEDRVFIVLIGHGNPRNGSAVFNLPGPDISAEEFSNALNVFEGPTLIIVNTASASGPFVKALADDNRIIISATSSAREYNATIFGGLFVAAFSEPGADTDKDERISILEAFNYARREVRRNYESDKRLLTEHALLDDNGDGIGSLDPGQGKTDGALAQRIYLQQPRTVPTDNSGKLTGLLAHKQTLEQSISALKTQRRDFSRVNYYQQLEILLIDLALVNRDIRAQGG